MNSKTNTVTSKSGDFNVLFRDCSGWHPLRIGYSDRPTAERVADEYRDCGWTVRVVQSSGTYTMSS